MDRGKHLLGSSQSSSQSSSSSTSNPPFASTSGVQPSPAATGAPGWRQISHRPTASMERRMQQQQQQYSQPHQQPNPTYSNASVPNSPSTDLTRSTRGIHNANLPANYSQAGYNVSSVGNKGVKTTGQGLGIGGNPNPSGGGAFGMFHPSRSKYMDDNASLVSLIDNRDGTGPGSSEMSHSYSDNLSYSHHSLSNLNLDLPVPGISPETAKRTLREKTSYTHLKNSDHKILSNEEKYNAYVVPGVAQYDGPEPDDALHDPGPRLKGKGTDRRLEDSSVIHGHFSFASWRGWLNVLGLALVLLPIVGFFAAYPMAQYFVNNSKSTSMRTNSTGQVPDIPNFRGLVDRDTPTDVYTKTGADGHEYTLVFSDEFETDGRTFYDGDDPYWTAMDFYYHVTADLEYYDPSAATTAGGYLVLNLTQVPDPSLNHDLDYMSGMLQSWNKFCFTGGRIETRVSLPGSSSITGLWPAFWTMGNLGRAGYAATTDGTWPFSYDACDSGTLPNQTDFSKQTMAVQTSEGNDLSYLPGQKLSACTCKGEDHPGPSHDIGRGAPEIDVFEALVNEIDLFGEASQTLQMAPFDMDYLWDNTSDTYSLGAMRTHLNAYHGNHYQESVSALARTDQVSYMLEDPTSFSTWALEYMPSEGKNYDGYANWIQNDQVTWSLQEAGLTGNASIDISQRLIPREPMYMIMNLGMAWSFNKIDLKHLTFPAIMRFDYIRVYQRSDAINIGCDPKNFPTADYIDKHNEVYTNPNLTIWTDYEPAGFPKNSLLDKC